MKKGPNKPKSEKITSKKWYKKLFSRGNEGNDNNNQEVVQASDKPNQAYDNIWDEAYEQRKGVASLIKNCTLNDFKDILSNRSLLSIKRIFNYTYKHGHWTLAYHLMQQFPKIKTKHIFKEKCATLTNQRSNLIAGLTVGSYPQMSSPIAGCISQYLSDSEFFLVGFRLGLNRRGLEGTPQIFESNRLKR